MEKLHKRVLDKSMTDFENDLEPMDVTSELISKEIMVTDDIEVLEGKPRRKLRVREFISILKRRGPKAFPAFLQSLKEISHYKTLLQTLEDRERKLKTENENKIKEMVTSADTKDTFAFLEMKLNLAEHLNRRDSLQLCELLKLSKETYEEIHISPNPGMTFIRAAGDLNFIATQSVSSILEALENFSLQDAAKVVKDYLEELSFPEIEVSLEASERSSGEVTHSTPSNDIDDIFSQDKVESFYTWQRLRNFFQKLFAVRLFDLRKGNIVLVLKISTVDNLDKLENDICSGDLAQQLLPILLKETNQKFRDEHRIEINLTCDHRHFQGVKQKLTHKNKFHEDLFPIYIPPQEELQDGNMSQSSAMNRNFSDLLETLGLNNMFPGGLGLKNFIKVNNRQSIENESDFVFLFWQKLSSLDYRIRSRIFLKLNDSPAARPVSIRDFIFAVMQCSNRFLRQDIIEKMSACHLAVPVVLQGIRKQKPEFLLWSLRRIVKKWKESNSIALEQHIVHVPVFTVSFLRIGEIKTVSKSSIINSLLGPYQGNDAHPFFLTRDEDLCNPSFSKGCIESVWYLPMNTNGSEKLRWITCFLNLRGDCTKFPMQTEFACKAANITIIFIAIKSLERYQETIKHIKSSANSFFFIGINDEYDKVSQKEKYTQPKQDWLYYHSLELEDVLDRISEAIIHCHAGCSTDKYTKLDGLVELCCKDKINNEEDVKECNDAKVHVKEIIDIGTKEDLSDFKKRVFLLQAAWVDWVSIDKERLRPDAEREESVEFSLDNIARRKAEKRQQQLDSGLSETMKVFMTVLRDSQNNMGNLDYFLFYLQETLFRLADEATRAHFKNISYYDEEIQKLDALIQPKPQRASDTSKREVVKTSEAESRYKQDRLRWKSLRQEEHEKCMEKNIGWEHFLRELGQWHEAHTELKVNKDELCMSLPGIASRLVCHGYSIEIMDGDTGRLPVSWITSVLDKLAQDLNDPNILVLSVIGVQSSGKSTLLNSMFGVKFPVRAGRCTRGLFMQMLTVDETYVKKLGLKYIMLIDSEGIRSFERNSKEECRFDNELVTLALCISDVTILNVEGENIGPEMTGILEIAAHASIRMTEVELYSQCRIIQQRVSDLTASERNKINMNQIVEMLNEAVRVASKEEGYGDRYEKFSDVLGLRLDDNLQFIPCLWTGPMSPPSQFYSDVVTKVKEDIFCEIERKKVVPQFSVSSFNQRIRDVWRAVKDEKFLFNFKDSIKAVDFNNMCMELSKHFTDMRLSLVEKRVEWHKLIQSSVGEPDETLEKIKQDCQREIQAKQEGIKSAISSFISQHKRKDNLSVYEKWINQNVQITVTDIHSDILSVLQTDTTTKKLQNNIARWVTKARSELQSDAKTELNRLGTSGNKQPTAEVKRNFEKIFSMRWNKLLAEGKEQFPLKIKTEKSLEANCEELLISITQDMAVSTEIQKLIKEEGGIRKHVTVEDWGKYFPDKAGEENVKDWIVKNQPILDEVIRESVSKYEEKSFVKYFDANLYQSILRNAFWNISQPPVSADPPYSLKAKMLLHIGGRLFYIALQKQRSYEKEHSFEKLFDKEKQNLRQDFLSLLRRENEVDRAVRCIERYFFQWGNDLVLNRLRQNFSLLMTEKGLTNNYIISNLVLKELSIKNESDDYIKYTNHYNDLVNEWINQEAVKICSSREGGKGLRSLAEALMIPLKLDVIHLVRLVRKDLEQEEHIAKNQEKFKTWVDLFIREILMKGFTNHRELSMELYSFEISEPNVGLVTEELLKFLRSRWVETVFAEIKLPREPNLRDINKFVKDFLRSTIDDLFRYTCFEQCPLCKAPCSNPLPRDLHHKHLSFTHLPRGITGAKYKRTSQLNLDSCPSCVMSTKATYPNPSDKKGAYRLCRNYKKDFPNWNIQAPSEMIPDHSIFWKWVMAEHNKKFAKYYGCKNTKIPLSWRRITKQEALESLEMAVSGLSVTVKRTSIGIAEDSKQA